jgi:hypothetical protein
MNLNSFILHYFKASKTFFGSEGGNVFALDLKHYTSGWWQLEALDLLQAFLTFFDPQLADATKLKSKATSIKP